MIDAAHLTMFLELHFVALVDDDESSSEVVDEHEDDENVDLICNRSIIQLVTSLQC